jgi:hypothetical protein
MDTDEDRVLCQLRATIKSETDSCPLRIESHCLSSLRDGLLSLRRLQETPNSSRYVLKAYRIPFFKTVGVPSLPRGTRFLEQVKTNLFEVFEIGNRPSSSHTVGSIGPCESLRCLNICPIAMARAAVFDVTLASITGDNCHPRPANAADQKPAKEMSGTASSAPCPPTVVVDHLLLTL